MTEQEEKILAALESGRATRDEQAEAARIIRDLAQEVRELSDWNTRD